MLNFDLQRNLSQKGRVKSLLGIKTKVDIQTMSLPGLNILNQDVLRFCLFLSMQCSYARCSFAWILLSSLPSRDSLAEWDPFLCKPSYFTDTHERFSFSKSGAIFVVGRASDDDDKASAICILSFTPGTRTEVVLGYMPSRTDYAVAFLKGRIRLRDIFKEYCTNLIGKVFSMSSQVKTK